MGFGIPAAIGAKLASPDRQVLAIEGDGSFLMTGEEMTTAYQYGLPIVVLLLNNYGWISIRDHQIRQHGEKRTIATEFIDKQGELYSPDFVKLAEAYRCYGEKVEKPEDIKPALKRAFDSGKPAIVEARVSRKFPVSGAKGYTTWDLAPIPSYLKQRTIS